MLNRIAILIDKIRYNRQWQIVFVAICAIVIVIFFIFYLATTNNTPKNVDNITQNNNDPTVTNSDFQSSEFLTSTFGKPAGLSSGYAFTSGQKAILVDENQQLSIDGEVIKDSPTFYPQTIYSVSQSIIVNELTRSALYNPQTGFKPYREGTFSVIPSLISIDSKERNTPGYLFLTFEEKKISIFQSTDISLESPTPVNVINLGEGVEYAEIKIINQNPYLITYQNPVKQGLAEVFLIKNDNSLSKIQQFTNLESISFGDFGIFTTFKRGTANNLTLYTQRYIDFSSNQTGDSKVADFNSELATFNVFGSVLAERCNLVSAEEVVCLIKEGKNLHTDYEKLDKIVRYNFNSKKLSLVNEGLIFSADSILRDKNGNLYIISQESRNFYKVNIQ